MAFRLGASSDRGRMREGNEDSFLASGSLAAVADGMGGHLAGEVASAAATDELRSLQDGAPWRGERSAGEALKWAVMEANRRIREMAAGDKSLEGMGTTITALLSDGDVVHLAHVGDSRAYLLRKGELSQLTEDHTLVQELVKQGKLRPEDAKRHPQGSIITRALGVDAEVQVDTATFKIVSGDRLLLCTDGLTGVVDQTTIRNVLLRVRDPQKASERLVVLANEQGGPDNITVVVLDAGGVGADTGVIDPTGDLAADGAATAGRGLGGDRGGPGTDEVSIFRGVPGDVAGLHLSSLVERSPVTREKVPPAYVLSLENGVSAGSLAEARRIAACAPVVYQQPDCTIAGPASTTSVAPTTTKRPTTTTKKKG